jgi:ribosomal protein S18 acetylase RimI-like enzyme
LSGGQEVPGSNPGAPTAKALNLVRADSLPPESLAALFTASYAGYFVPIHVDAPTFRQMVESWDIDLAKSRVALDGERPIGIALLGIRGDRGWIGGMGVVEAARRRGVGRRLMEAILTEAPELVTLEVVEQNEPAIRLYEQLGFAPRRTLEVWSLTADVAPTAARATEPRPLDQADLPWQRQDASLPRDYERIEVDGGAALIRVVERQATVLQLEARDEVAAAQLLAAARARGDALRYLNVPERDPASAALARLGGRLDLRQLEMRLSRFTS